MAIARVFVTGGGGFLANHLAVDLLARGHDVTMLVRGEGQADLPGGARVVRGDLLRANGAIVPPATEVVFHLAARSNVPESLADPAQTFEVNAFGTARLFDEIRTRGLRVRRVVLASTGQVYGPPRGRPLKESHPTAPSNPYSASKLAAESYALACDALYGIPTVVLRLFNVYGPGQRESFVVPSVLAQCLRSREVRIGNPWPVRDFLFVDDAVALFRLAGFRREARGEVLNAGSGSGTRIDAMVRLALRVTESDRSLHIDRVRQRANDFDKLVADISKARRVLGWRPKVTLREGLARTADSMREHPPGRLPS